MSDKQYLITISIPSFNRPIEIKRLLDSIDSKNPEKIQILICEDKSPFRLEIRKAVVEYKSFSDYEVKYIENEFNNGYDKNLRALIENADGEYLLFMGDDDVFIPEALDKLIGFIEQNKSVGYILRSYRNLYKNGEIEYFKYYDENKLFQPGIKTYTELFLKSVFISGFTIKRKYIADLSTDKLDGTLLYQLYLVAEVCMKYPSAYFNTPLTQAISGGIPYFGSSESEKGLYETGRKSTNDLKFIAGTFKVTKYLDEKHGINTTDLIKRDLSKYSYPLMANWRPSGFNFFRNHCKGLVAIGLNNTIYFYIYYYGLLFLGKTKCDRIIRIIKMLLGRRPNL